MKNLNGNAILACLEGITFRFCITSWRAKKWYPLLLYQAHDTNKKGRGNNLLQLEHPNNFLPRYGYLSYVT